MARAPRQREIAYSSNPFLMTIGEELVSSSRFPKWGQLLALRGTGPGVFAAYSRASALVARRSSCCCYLGLHVHVGIPKVGSCVL